MKVAIHQPQYLPWSGYFNKILQCDIFVFLDDVQYKKNEWQNRNRIKTATGEQWLTIPVHYKFGQKINEIEIDNKIHWRKDHLKAIKVNYSKSKFFNEFFPIIENLLNKEYKKLIDINIESVKVILSYLGIEKKMVLSSQLQVEGEKTERLVNICKKLSAKVYISGIGAKDYLQVERFRENNIEVVFQQYTTPRYPQLFGEFIPDLSIIDMIFNVGKNETLKLIS